MNIDLLRNHENGPIAQSWKWTYCAIMKTSQLL